MDKDARAPLPGVLADYAGSYVDREYLEGATPLAMLRLSGALRVALRAYDEKCVFAARMARASWAEIGDAIGMERQNAQRKYRHLPNPRP